MSEYKNVPKAPRIMLSVVTARKFLKSLDVSEIPVNPFKIVKENYNWQLKKCYINRLALFRNIEEVPHFDELNTDGMVEITKENKYIIYLDKDCLSDNEYRVNFTLAHEIGHIVLNHLVDFDVCSANDAEIDILDKEANAFAGELLMPINAVKTCHLKSLEEFASYFCVTKTAMQTRLHYVMPYAI